MEPYSKKLDLIEECLKRLETIANENPTLIKYRNSWKDKDATERNIQKIIEAILDIGKMVVADRKLREPGNNREVFIILEENGLFPSEFIPLMDNMIGMRNIIVHGYNRIDDSIVYGVLKKNLDGIKNLNEHFKRAIVKIPADLK